MIAKLILIMGVSGTGKSTLADTLAKHLSFEYFDADDFHSDQAISFMKRGVPINPIMRQAWIDRMKHHFSCKKFNNKNIILAYSGLKHAHRKTLSELAKNVTYVLIEPEPSLLKTRLKNRKTHFFSPHLLTDQLNQFEPLSQMEAVKTIMLTMKQTNQQQITRIVQQQEGYNET